jgi:hypothetical protein
MPDKDTKPKEKTPRFTLGAVATQTEDVIVDNETKTHYTILTAIAKLLNDVEEIKKRLV